MEKAPKSLRLQIGLFGRTNVGKSSFLNIVSGQDVAITSPFPGTTSDVVEKTMELLPLGPVVFLDTAGMDDTSMLSGKRINKSRKILDRSDVIILVVEPDRWDSYEADIIEEARERNTPVILVVNKIDTGRPSSFFMGRLKALTENIMMCSSIDSENRDKYVNALKRYLIKVCPGDFLNPPPLIGDLLPSGGLAVLIVPIDLEAPKGRLILPQVQVIRDGLDNDASVMVVKETEFPHVMRNFRTAPDIVICDSQVVMKMVADTPEEVKCSTFSIVFSRYKGDIIGAARAVAVVGRLKPGDRVLIAEACSHHPIEDDIGRVKIPRWLRQYTGGGIEIDVSSGRDYPEDISVYKLIIHCGACMLTRRETLFRLHRARQEGIPVTNYGLCISFMHGVLKRVLSPFPAALDAFESEMSRLKKEGDEE